MSDYVERPIMSGEGNGIEVILVRMEGKIDRQSDRLERFERDIVGVRSRLHDLANEVTPLTMLDLPGRIRTADQMRSDHDSRLTALENLEQRRAGAAGLIKVIWAVAGAAGVGGVAAVLRVLQVGGL